MYNISERMYIKCSCISLHTHADEFFPSEQRGRTLKVREPRHVAFGKGGSGFHMCVCGDDSAKHPFTPPPRDGRAGDKNLNSVLLEWEVASHAKAMITTQHCKDKEFKKRSVQKLRKNERWTWFCGFTKSVVKACTYKIRSESMYIKTWFPVVAILGAKDFPQVKRPCSLEWKELSASGNAPST